MKSIMSYIVLIIAIISTVACAVGRQIHYTSLPEFKLDTVGVTVRQMQKRDRIDTNVRNKKGWKKVPVFIIEPNSRKDPELFFNTPEELISFYKETIKSKHYDGIFLKLAADKMYSVSDHVERRKLIEKCQENNIVVYVFRSTPYPPFKAIIFVANVY